LVLLKTFRLCKYLWMLNEGWYLHKLIVSAFSEQTKTRYFHIVAWGVPVILMIPYVIVRSQTDRYNPNCWTGLADDWEWLFNAGHIFCIVVSATNY